MIKATMSNVTGFTIVIVAFIEWLRNMDQGLLLMSFPAEYLKQLRGWRSCVCWGRGGIRGDLSPMICEVGGTRP